LKKEGETHREMRESAISVLERVKRPGQRVVTSHSDRSEQRLFFGEPSRRTHMSDADILLIDDRTGKVDAIVEIKDRDVRPKNIVGIIGCTSICDKHVDRDGREYATSGVLLFIVVPDQTLGKNGSSKRAQLEGIVERMAENTRPLRKCVVCSAAEFAATCEESLASETPGSKN